MQRSRFLGLRPGALSLSLTSVLTSCNDNANHNPRDLNPQGDRVAVVAGDLTGMKGRVQRLGEDGIVFVVATSLDMKEAIEIEARDLIKFFNVRTL